MNNEQQRKVTQNIKAQYESKSEKVTKLEQLQRLNAKVHRPADVFAYSFGTVGALILGTGMSIAMEVILPGLMPLGIAIGVVGLGMVALNYFIHKAILTSRKKKYAEQIIKLSDELLND